MDHHLEWNGDDGIVLIEVKCLKKICYLSNAQKGLRLNLLRTY